MAAHLPARGTRFSRPLFSSSRRPVRGLTPAGLGPRKVGKMKGGNFSDFHSVNRQTVTPASAVNGLESLMAKVRIMASILSSDLANGRMGTRHNIYAHRSRVLDTMREHKVGLQTQQQ